MFNYSAMFGIKGSRNVCQVKARIVRNATTWTLCHDGNAALPHGARAQQHLTHFLNSRQQQQCDCSGRRQQRQQQAPGGGAAKPISAASSAKCA